MKSENLSNILKSRGFKNIELNSIIETKHILKRSGGNFRQYLFTLYDQRNVGISELLLEKQYMKKNLI